ncbi:MAG: type IV secretion system DNA-binding domain-containing protein [Desulfobacca sp.]|nr:type IV secretion system DNA-binding domain-containing protein [Desulfobacca sp.]
MQPKKSKPNTGLLRSLGRGAETLGQSARVTLKSLIVSGLISGVLTIGATVAYLAYAQPGTPSVVWAWAKAETVCPIETTMGILPVGNKRPDWLAVNDPHGQPWYPCALADQLRPGVWAWGGDYARTGGVIWLLSTAVVTGMIARRGRRQVGDQWERGAQVIEASKFKPDYLSRIAVAGVPLPPDTETQHLLAQGAPGTGKSTIIFDLADQARARRDRCIFYDSTGELIQLYYRQDRGDVILNSLCAESEHWTPWADMRYPWDGTNLANWLIPLDNTTDQFWALGARALLGAGLDRTPEQSVVTLLDGLCTTNLKALGKLAQGTAAAALISEKNAKTALGVQATLAANTQSLRYLWAEGNGQKPFGIGDWIKNGPAGSCLFIASPADQQQALRPLLTVWWEIAATTILSLPPSRDRRIWLFLDELPTLGRLEAVPRLLAQGRKYGVCGVLGIQSYAQLKEIYGDAGANAMGGQCSTWVTLRVPDPESAEWAAKGLGEYEVTETTEGLSYGGRLDGLRISQSRQKRLVVLPSEIQALPDLEGYLRLSGSHPIIKITPGRKDRPALGPELTPIDPRRTVYGVLGGIPAHLQNIEDQA